MLVDLQSPIFKRDIKKIQKKNSNLHSAWSWRWITLNSCLCCIISYFNYYFLPSKNGVLTTNRHVKMMELKIKSDRVKYNPSLLQQHFLLSLTLYKFKLDSKFSGGTFLGRTSSRFFIIHQMFIIFTLWVPTYNWESKKRDEWCWIWRHNATQYCEFQHKTQYWNIHINYDSTK